MLNTEQRIEYRKKYNVKTKTTRLCPNCLNDKLVLLTSIKLKICADCSTEITWNLDKDQRSLL